jgi:Ca2+-binding EF-hand superfamily protein
MATVDSYLKNPKWVKRCDNSFNMLDKDKSGFLTRDDWLIGIGDLEKILPDRSEAIAKVKAAVEEFLDDLGLKEGMKIDKEQYKQLAAPLSLKLAEQFKRGEVTSIQKADWASFDAMDRNSNGYLSFDEYKTVLALDGLDEKAARAAFDLLDTNKNGKLNKKEFAAADVKFWCMPDDTSVDGLYGDQI